VLDSASYAVGATGTNGSNLNPTNNALSSVSGTGEAGSTIYLYDNTSTNMVGSSIVGADGRWTISNLSNAGAGSNSFAAVQVDIAGNTSVLSNLWTVTAGANNLVTNGTFTTDTSGWVVSGAGVTTNNNTNSGVLLFNAGETAAGASVYQVLPTTLGTNYTVSMSAGLSNTVQTHTFLVEAVDENGTVLNSVTKVLNSATAQTVTFNFAATSSATTLRITNTAVSNTLSSDMWVDAITVLPQAPANNSTLTAGNYPQNTTGSGETTLSYTAGALDGQGGNDTITVNSNNLSTQLAAGGRIDGGAGVDTLKLAANTTLDLTALTSNQTVKPIQEVEIFQMQGGSKLTLSANDVLSLGGANLTGYSFSSGGTVTTSSTGKVQMVITGTSTDVLTLATLAKDGVTTNGVLGNTDLDGEWIYKGTTIINSVTYKVYDHSTTQAQVLSTVDATLQSDQVAFSSMTKDSGTTGANADWLTSDSSAGRLISGTLAEPLASGSVVKVYANGTLLGIATVNAAGTAWEYTDPNGYTANWTYRADVVTNNGSGTVTGSATQAVNLDTTAPSSIAITNVLNTANTSVASSSGSTLSINNVGRISGTVSATDGDTVTLYDASNNTVVGTTTVSGGVWSVANSSGQLPYGTNSLYAVVTDTTGNSTTSAKFDVTVPRYNFSGLNAALNSSNLAGNYYTEAQIDTALADPNLLTYTGTGTTKKFDVYSGKSISGASIKFLDTNNDYGNDGDAYTTQVSGLTAGKTYTVYFEHSANQYGLASNYNTTAYFSAKETGTNAAVQVGGASFQTVSNNSQNLDANGNYLATGSSTFTFVAPASGKVSFTWTESGTSSTGQGSLLVGNFQVYDQAPATGLASTAPAVGTPNVDTLTYAGGAMNTQASDDTITVTSTGLGATLAAGGYLSGGAGVDTLKLASGTVLDLQTLTNNQTVKPIQEIEIFTLQGSSALTLSANDVLSLGAANLTGYSFANTTQGGGATGSTVSTNKVQLVVHGTSSDTLVLNTLKTDGVTTNGIQGNADLPGQWDYMGTASTANGTYKVYNHSKTGAQVLVDSAVNVLPQDPDTVTKTVNFSSMTKDSGTTGANADWTTNDASAGRLVSGTVSTALSATEVVKVYANGTAVGTATLNADRTAWEFTDTQGYSGSWVYTAQVVDASGKGGAVALQQVNADLTVAAPVITAVIDSLGASVGATGTNTGNLNPSKGALSSVSGTGEAGSTIYLYDNSIGTLVGSTTVGSDGKWTVSSLSNVNGGSNSFAAVQLDTSGNTSVLSNLWTVSAVGPNLLTNGDFSTDSATAPVGFTTDVTWRDTALTSTQFDAIQTTGYTNVTTSTNASGTTSGISWSKAYIATQGNPDGAMTGNSLATEVHSNAKTVFWRDSTIQVEAGKTYAFKLDYNINYGGGGKIAMDVDGVSIDITSNAYESGHFTAVYTATSNKTITLALWGINPYTANPWYGISTVDNLSFAEQSSGSGANSLTPGNYPQNTTGSGEANLIYTVGALDGQGGDDTITASSNTLATVLSAGGHIDGGSGVDTLKLAAGTTLNLIALTQNQTVKSIEQVEVFEMQGTSTLTMSANDVLSLGGANATTMSTYTFTSTTGGTGSTSSTGKVQFVVNGTATDTLNLDGLLSDSNGGNGSLTGSWANKGATSISVGGVATTYTVYDHSTTQAQVLVKSGVTVSLSTSPLVLDLNGDGIQTTELDQGVIFDLIGSGQSQNTAWVDRHDGFLVLDYNRDGLINNGTELFGNGTMLSDGTRAADGWNALAALDSNHDGKVDAGDTMFKDLCLWVDVNGDGITEAGELHTLSEFSIAGMSLAHDESVVQQNGNILSGISAVIHSDGTITQMTDLWLRTSDNLGTGTTSGDTSLQTDAHDQATTVTIPTSISLVDVINGNQADLTNTKVEVLKLSANDVLQLPTSVDGKHQLQVVGDSSDVINLSKVFADGRVSGEWAQSGSVTENGHTFNVYQHSGDQSLQVLIDQQIMQSNVHLS